MKQKKSSCNVFFHLLFILLLTCNFLLTKPAAAQKMLIKVGVVVNMDSYVGQMGLNSISMALSEFYATHSHYKTRLSLTNRNSKGDVVKAAAAALDLLKNVKVQAIIGPLYSSEANFMIFLGDKAQVPIITFSATSPSLSSLRSTYFVRATLSDSSQVEAIAAIVQAYGWQEVVLIYEDNVFGDGIVPFLTSALEHVNARIPYRSVLPSLATDAQIEAQLNKLMTMHTRVFVVHMLTDLGSRLFTKAKEQGMMSEDYVWITTDGMGYELNSMDPLVLQSMFGVVGVRPYIPKTNELDKFKIRYKKRMQQNNPKVLSPELNIFGLWAYDAATALAIAVEKAGLTSNLDFLEANISRNSTDLESFGKSLVGPKLIDTLFNTTFEGLAGTFHLDDGQLQSPPYEIINVVGPGDRVIGYWTKENGIIRELNFTTANITQYSTNKSNFGSIIWPGDKTSPGKGWVIPTGHDKKLRVGVPVKEGFSEFVKVTWNPDNSVTVGGFCIEVFDEVMNLLPYGVPYEYIPFATPDHKMAGAYDDLVQQVYLGNFDAVAGDVTIIANRSKEVDFTLPYMESSISMVVPFAADKRKNGWIFVDPLTWQLWLTIFGAFLIIGIMIWFMEHPTNEEFRGPAYKQVGMVFWFAFSTMVFAHKEKVVSNPAKFLLIAWFFVVLIITQSYTASLASMLTLQQLHPAVNDVNKLIENNLYVGYKNGSFVYEFLKLRFNEDRLLPFNSPEEMDELFKKGSGKGGIAAAFHEIPYIKLFLGKYCSQYTMVDPIYKADGFGFVFPRGSPLVPDVSRAILNFTEGKTMMDIENNWLRYNKKCSEPDTSNSGEQSLRLASFWGLFVCIAIVAVLVLGSFIFMLHINWQRIDVSENDSIFKRWRNNREVDKSTPKTESEKISEVVKLAKAMLELVQENGYPTQGPVLVDSPRTSSGRNVATDPQNEPADTEIKEEQQIEQVNENKNK